MDATKVLAERWDGRSWKVQRTPSVSDGFLRSVSCASPSACIAVGDVFTNTGTGGPLAERWNGRRWTLQKTPDTSGGGFYGGTLHGVSCISASDCIAVGSYVPPADQHNGGSALLVERWNGRTWTVQPAPDPPTVGGYKSPPKSELDGVSCSSARACIAVGQYTPAQYKDDPLAERWNGTKWTITPTPRANNRLGMAAVSCASANACTAVGIFGRHVGDGVERWNGRNWTIQRSAPTPDGNLVGVSCPSKSRCTAVGTNPRGSRVARTLAERWNR